MTSRRAVSILRCTGQRSRSQGHKIENANSAILNQLYTIFSVIFQRIFAKDGLYIGSTSCINPVKFQVRTPIVKVIVRHNTKCGQCYNLQMARYSLNNSSIHPTYFLPTQQKSQDIVNPCPRTFRPRTRLMKANKSQRRSKMHNTLHNHTPQYVMLLF